MEVLDVCRCTNWSQLRRLRRTRARRLARLSSRSTPSLAMLREACSAARGGRTVNVPPSSTNRVDVGVRLDE